jgi:NodT family efflux transporter outer membrane factor (OMF) lipoprotein
LTSQFGVVLRSPLSAWHLSVSPLIKEQCACWAQLAVPLGTPTLDRLIDEALQQNLSLRSAGLRVLQSQQQLAIAVGSQYPQEQQLTGSAARQRSNQTTFNNYDLGFNLSWEVDFWGRFSRQVESASAALDASVAGYDSVIVSLVSQVANNYVLIRTFQERIKVANNNIALQESSLRIARAKFEAGDVSELDVYQAESLVNNTRATVSSLEVSLRQLKNGLAVLLGKTPEALNYLLTEEEEVPVSQTNIALGMPQDLIRRRPDIRIAERQLAAQSAQIGYAVTELYPHFVIGGSIGTEAEDGGDLFSSNSETWNLFGSFEWNIFNYGRLKSNVRLQDAFFQQLLVDYRNTVLQAQSETENAIIAYLKSHEQLALYQRAAEASEQAVEISKAQYDNGMIDYNTVITTLKSDEQQQDLYTSTKGSVATNLIQVYKSLGGGWQIRDNRDPVSLLPESMKEEMRQRTKYWKGTLK